MLLRDHPPGTTADVTDYCVLFLNGGTLHGAHLSDNSRGESDELINVEDVLREIHENVAAWLAHPRFSYRPASIEWLKEAPLIESGVD